MGLLDGGMAATLGAVFAGTYLPGNLQPVTLTKQPGGRITEALGDLEDCRYQPEALTQKMREREGYTDKDARFFVLQAGLAVEPTADWELIDRFGARWSIAHVDQDPARVYWDLHTRPSRRKPPAP